MRKVALLLAFLLILALPAISQVPVSLTPVAHQQFLDASGHPLSGGKVFFYNAGTTTPAPTYVDINGIILNSNPVILDSGGFATIYLANQEYKVCVQDQFSVQQWCQDNVSAFQAITGTPAIIFAGVTSDPGGTAGEIVFRSDIPCFRVFTTVWDCLLQLNAVQSPTNKTIDVQTNSVINDSANLAGHYLRNNGAKYADSVLNTSDGVTIYQNSGAIAPVLNEIAKFAGAATLAQTTDVAGFIGICVQNCSLGAQGQFQSSGIGSCVFDGATTVNDYVVNSTTVAGNCHDSGVAPPAATPTAVQLIGRVLSTNGGAGTYTIELFPPEIRIPAPPTSIVQTLNKQDTQAVATTGNGTDQTVFTFTLPGGSLAAGKCLNIYYTLTKVSGANVITPKLQFGATVIANILTPTGNTAFNYTAKVCNNAASTTAQWASTIQTGPSSITVQSASPVENTTANIIILATANVAAPDTWKGFGFVVVTDP